MSGNRDRRHEHDEYDDSIGWTRVSGVLSPERTTAVVAGCEAVLGSDDLVARTGDKPAAGTRRLTAVDERVEAAADIGALPAVTAVIDRILPGPYFCAQAVYRSPGPGHGGQELHADEMPRLDDGPYLAATAIIALVGFSETNGATRFVPGSHRRPDLQARASQLGAEGVSTIVAEAPIGTAIVFNGHLLHAGGENRSSRPRPAIQLSYRLAPDPPASWVQPAFER